MTASFTNATTRTSAAEFTAEEIVDANAIDASYSATVMRGLMKNKSLVGQNTNKYTFPAWPALSAAAVAETADLANTQVDPTEVSVTVGETGIMITPTDALREDSWVDLADYGQQGGYAVADKQDADSAALLAGFSNSTGTTGEGLTQARYLAAIRALEARDANKAGRLVSVLHPVQLAQMNLDVVENGGNIWAGVGDARFGAATRNMAVPVFGVPTWTTTNVTNDGTDYFGGMFVAGQALAFVAKREARTEIERDASARLTEIVITSRYGVGELVDNYGQEILSGMTA